MSVINLKSDYSNISEFVNSLYSTGVRTIDVVYKALGEQSTFAGFSDDGDMILKVWKAAWQEAQGDSYDPTDFKYCPESDQKIIAFLAAYLKQNKLSMFVPQLKYLEPTSEGPQYQLASYEKFDFLNGEWDYNIVQNMLEFLLYGAHFVVIHAQENLPPGVSVSSLWEDFQNDNSINANERKDDAGGILGNSHYTSTTNKNGWYYPIVDNDTTPADPCPFILSLLVCPTISTSVGSPVTYNTFMQLEGWELPTNPLKAKGSRHDRDYELYQQTYWNISTYGVSVYSEKRATAIFLAPSAWVPVPTLGTYMPPYVGAETPQSWLKTELVSMSSMIGNTSNPNENHAIYITVSNTTGSDFIITHIEMEHGKVIQDLPGIIPGDSSPNTFEAACSSAISTTGPKGIIYFSNGSQISFNHPYGHSKTTLSASAASGFKAKIDGSDLQHRTAKGSVTFQTT